MQKSISPHTQSGLLYCCSSSVIKHHVFFKDKNKSSSVHIRGKSSQMYTLLNYSLWLMNFPPHPVSNVGSGATLTVSFLSPGLLWAHLLSKPPSWFIWRSTAEKLHFLSVQHFFPCPVCWCQCSVTPVYGIYYCLRQQVLFPVLLPASLLCINYL